jgi:hypothetical protein
VGIVSAPRDLLAGWRAWRARAEALAPGTAQAEATPPAAPALDPAEVEALASALAEAAQTVAEVLRSAPPAEDAEAMAEHYASEPTADPYQPGDRDDLRDGLWAGARGRGSFPAGGCMRAAKARHLSSARAEFRGYTPARRPIPPGEGGEGEGGPAGDGPEAEFRRE